jgi:hypothetical protein
MTSPEDFDAQPVPRRTRRNSHLTAAAILGCALAVVAALGIFTKVQHDRDPEGTRHSIPRAPESGSGNRSVH